MFIVNSVEHITLLQRIHPGESEDLTGFGGAIYESAARGVPSQGDSHCGESLARGGLVRVVTGELARSTGPSLQILPEAGGGLSRGAGHRSVTWVGWGEGACLSESPGKLHWGGVGVDHSEEMRSGKVNPSSLSPSRSAFSAAPVPSCSRAL